MSNQIKSNLTDVSETMLWTLHNRATEAMRNNGIIKDEKCIEIYESIDYDYVRSFGKPDGSHAARSLIFDKHIKAFLEKHPTGTIVNLGEGLETQRFRLEGNDAFWLSVDLPEAIAIREQFILPDNQHWHSPVSVLDRKWFDLVPKNEPVFISAQGLFMYLKEAEVKSISHDIFNVFSEGYLMFDTIPKWISNKTMSEKGLNKTKYYTTPKMPWGINRRDFGMIKNWSENISRLEEIKYGFPKGARKWGWMLLYSIPILNRYAPSCIKIKFKNSKSL